MPRLKTRRIGAAVGVLCLTPSLFACSAPSLDPAKALAVTMWGGSAQRAHIDSYIRPWASQQGLGIAEDSPTDYAKLRAQVDSGRVSWGIVEMEPNFSESACAEGILTKLTPEVRQAVADAGIDPTYINDCAIPNLLYAFTIAYNTEIFPERHPTNWAEFFDVAAFPGKRGFWKVPTGGMFEAALLADGVQPDQLYPLDIDRAFRKLDTIKDSVVFYDTGDEQAQLVASGEAPLVQAWNGRIFSAAQNGQPVANEWGQNLVSYDQVAIPRGYPNTDAAMKWMAHFVGDLDGQAVDADATAYDPVNPQALDRVSAEVVDQLAGYGPNREKSATTIDYRYWAANYDAVNDRLNAWAMS